MAKTGLCSSGACSPGYLHAKGSAGVSPAMGSAALRGASENAGLLGPLGSGPKYYLSWINSL